MSLLNLVPWWAKIGIKLCLARVPVDRRTWRRLNLFVNGPMDQPDYAIGVIRSHLNRAKWRNLNGRVIAELGPGDSLASAVIAKALGADGTFLVDSGDFADRALPPYIELAEILRRDGLAPPDLSDCSSIDDLLVRCKAEYLTNGITDLRGIADAKVDFVFSQAVLEHVRKGELRATLAETFRLTKPGGVASHRIDLTDHLGGGLSNLRFSETIWESDWMSRSGFYTNRVRASEMLALFREAGWAAEVTETRKWAALPTPRTAMAAPFRGLATDELLISGFDVLARKP